jgi:hypothetical protein
MDIVVPPLGNDPSQSEDVGFTDHGASLSPYVGIGQCRRIRTFALLYPKQVVYQTDLHTDGQGERNRTFSVRSQSGDATITLHQEEIVKLLRITVPDD